MKFKSTVKGSADFKQALQQMDRAASRGVLLDALKDGAEPIRETAAALAPRSTGRGPHLADHIVIAETRFSDKGAESLDPDVVTVAIGPSHKPHDMFYGFFQEFGTARHPAHPFLRPAFDRERKTALRRVAQSLRARLAKVGR